MVCEREDLGGINLSATFKRMRSGERRWRLRPLASDLDIFSVHASKSLAQGWQEAHAHTGLLEHYLVLKGKVGFVTRSTGDAGVADFSYGVMEFADGVFSFLPGEVHNIYTGCGAEFVTIQQYQGRTVPNPDRNGEDWWPADAAFNESVRRFMAEVEKTF